MFKMEKAGKGTIGTSLFLILIILLFSVSLASAIGISTTGDVAYMDDKG